MLRKILGTIVSMTFLTLLAATSTGALASRLIEQTALIGYVLEDVPSWMLAITAISTNGILWLRIYQMIQALIAWAVGGNASRNLFSKDRQDELNQYDKAA